VITTVNFRMVRLAREFRGLSQSVLAARAGLPQARLSRIETGQLVPLDRDLDSISSALGLPPAFFLEPGAPVATPIFRKRAIRSVKALAAIHARVNTAVLIAERVLNAGIDIDPPQCVPEPGQFPADEPDRAAATLRRDWRLPPGRVDDVTSVIEAMIGVVLRIDFGTSDAAAAFVPAPEGRLWFLVNTRETSGDRVRLSLAHELGHAVLHRMLPAYDETEFERQAFAFAAHLLLPPDHFNPSVPYDGLTLSEARRLKNTFGVSMQAIIRAAYARELISRARYTSLFKQLSARQWRVYEPDPIPVETPTLWSSTLDVHRVEHGYSDAELAGIARVSPDVLAEIFPESFSRPRALRLVGSANAPRIAPSFA
jgi:Zn-dependent peptidase ImmA (M78 family)